MERSSKSSNGRGVPVLEKEVIKDSDTLAKVVLAPVADPETEDVKPLLPQAGQKNSTSKHPRRNVFILAGLGVAAVVAGSFGYQWWQFASTHQETDDAAVAGNVHPISSRIDGTVTDVLVNDNQQVQQGETLVKLDTHDEQVQVQQAQAALLAAQRQAVAAQANVNLASGNAAGNTQQAQGNVASARAAIATAAAAVKAAQTGVPTARAAVAQADANLQRTLADYNRYNNLFQQGAVPRQQLDTARADYQVAVAQKNSAVQGVAQAEANLAQAQENVTKARAQLAAAQGELQQAQAGGLQTQVNRSQYGAAQAAIAQAQAKLQDAQLQLSYTNITAPTAGIVGRKTVQVGQRVQSGTPLMSVVDNDKWVVANFKETQLERMQPGERAEVKLDAFPHHPFYGRVESFSPGTGATFALLPPDNATGNFTKIVQRVPVKVVLEPQSIKGYESRITPGMSAVVTVDIGK